MVNKSLVENILDLAVQAPSGDNAQPWQFRISDDAVFVYNAAGKDATLYNFNEQGSYLAHGAVVENICILAPTRGLRATVQLFPGDAECVAKITFTPSAAADDILAVNIPKRCTNRKPYSKKKPLDEADKNALTSSIEACPNIAMYCAEGDKVARLSDLVSLNERLLFENQPLHDFLFSMIRWTRAEEQRSTGLYVKTMEFPIPLQFLLRYVFSNFAVVRELNKIGLSRFIPTQSAQVYKTSSAFFAFTIKSTSNADFVTAGRAMQRFWLTAQERGLNVQPTAGIPYLAARINAGAAQALSKEHQDAVLATNASISEILGIRGGERIAMLMRIGYGSDPTARSLKSPPKILS